VSSAPLFSDRSAASAVRSPKTRYSSSLISISAWIGLAVLLSFAPQHAPAIAQDSSPAASPQTDQSVNNKTILIVNPTFGDDSTADGSEHAPFKTISKALQVARPNTVIQLVPGTYSEETGETFPLYLKAGITIQGNSENRGSDITIRGSGFFLSATSARQNVAILGANNAALIGTTVINPHPQGYGLWVESTSPTVTDNTFTANGHDGISVTGKGAPLIRNNYFYQNGANGITVYGSSRPEIRENIFEQTGFAININQSSAPLIIGNRITQNKDGVVVQGKSHPVLRNNSIEGNERDGLVAIGESRPDLGTPSEPGGNFIRNNSQFDINAKRTSQTISAVGNELIKTTGQLDTSGATNTNLAVATPEASPPAAKSDQATSAPSKETQPEKTLTVSTPKPSSASALTLAASSVSFGERPSSAQAPVQVSVATTRQTASSSSFPVPSALAGKSDEPQTHRPIQMVRLTNSRTTAASPATQESGKIAKVTEPQKPGESEVSAETTFPVPSLLKPSSPSLAIVPNSPPVSVPLRVSETAQNVSDPTRYQATALVDKVPMQVRLPMVERVPPPPIAASVVREKPAFIPPKTDVSISPKTDVKEPKSASSIEIKVPPPESPSTPTAPEVVVKPSQTSDASRPVVISVPTPDSKPDPVTTPAGPRPITPPPPISTGRADSVSLLPVPDSNVPIGNAGSASKLRASISPPQLDASGPPAPPARGELAEVRYRVIVETEDDSQLDQIRSLVPNAFRTSLKGRAVMQVGAFGDRGKADQLVQSLVSQGLKAIIETME